MGRYKITLNLDQSNINDVLNIFKKYGREFPYSVYSEIDDSADFCVKWSQPGEPTMINTFSNGGNGIINIHYEPMGYALLAKKSDMPFDWAVRLNGSGERLYEVVKQPKDFVNRAWLKEKCYRSNKGSQETNEMFTVLLFLCARVMTIWFVLALDGKEDANGIAFTPKKNFYKVASESYEKMKETLRVEHLYDNTDTVTLDEKQFTKMAEYVDDVGMMMDINTLPLENFAFRFIKHDGGVEAYFYTMLDGGLLIVVDSERKGAKRFSFCILLKESINPETGEKGWESELKTDVSCGENEIEWLNHRLESGLTNWEWLVYSYFGINTFMLNYRDVSVDVQEIECKPNDKVSRPGKRKERTVVKMFKRYTLKKDWKRGVARKRQEYHCLAWGVRGHFRTLRNGRKVFVRPYVKGKEKDKYIPKDYIPIPPDV